jgi:hypothetical protein
MRCSAWKECQNECELKTPHPERLGDSIRCNIAEGVTGATSVEYIPSDVPVVDVPVVDVPTAEAKTKTKRKEKKEKKKKKNFRVSRMHCGRRDECDDADCPHYKIHPHEESCEETCHKLAGGAVCTRVEVLVYGTPIEVTPQKTNVTEELVICAGWHHCELPNCSAGNNPEGVEHRHPHTKTSSCDVPCRSVLGVEGSTCIPFTDDIRERYLEYRNEQENDLQAPQENQDELIITDTAVDMCIHSVCGHKLPTKALTTKELPDGSHITVPDHFAELEAEVRRLKETILIMNQNQQAVVNRERDLRYAMKVAIHYCGEHPGMCGSDLFTDIVSSFAPMEEVAVAWVKAYNANEAMLANFKDEGD